MKHEIDLPDLPDGFEYTGEYREPRRNEWFMDDNGDALDRNLLCAEEIGSYPILVKTAPLNLIDRIEAEYEDYKVIKLGFDKPCADGLRMLCSLGSESHLSHVIYQSIKGFYRYVYEIDGLFTRIEPIYSRSSTGEMFTPVAVLFNK